jgi:hypothetical protein
MPKSGRDNPDPLRIRIAQTAARLMIDHGIQDYGLAKRKAARQLGMDDRRHMPSNDEIDAALLSHHALFNQHGHAQILHAMRRQALEIMRALEPFNPHLAGAVLKGTAGPHSDIHILLFSDSTKDVEHHLLAMGWRYTHAACGNHRSPRADEPMACFRVDMDPAPIRLEVLHPIEARSAPRNQDMRSPRANIRQTSALLESAIEREAGPPPDLWHTPDT